MKQFYVRLKTEEQLKAVRKWGRAEAVIYDWELREKGRCPQGEFVKKSDETAPVKEFLCLPDVARERQAETIFRLIRNCPEQIGMMIKNLDELGMLKQLDYQGEVLGDSFLYAYNQEAVMFYLDCFPKMRFVFSDELTDRELQELTEACLKTEEKKQSVRSGFTKDRFLYKIYGCQPLMITNQCFGKNVTGCREKRIRFRDEAGNAFEAAASCGQCYSTIYNGKSVSMLDKLSEIPYENLLVDLTCERYEETKHILDCCSMAAAGNDSRHRSGHPAQITRGHHYKGIK